MAKTVMQVLESTVSKHGDELALKAQEGGAWKSYTWSEYDELSRRVARGLIKLGLEKGQGVAIIGRDRPEWFFSDIGGILAGGVPAGIYTTCSPAQCQYITDHCDAAVAVVEDTDQLAKFMEVRDQLPKLKGIVLMDGSDDDDDVHTWDELLAMGDDVPVEDLAARMKDQEPDDLCTLIYTSGTTGPPKAVMMSHDNLTWTTASLLDEVGGGFGPGDNVVCYLPLSHIAEQVVGLHLPMAIGGCSWCCMDMEKLGDVLREVRPSIFLGVPRVWEKIQAKITAAGAQNPPLKRKIGAWARKVGLAGGYADQQGKPRPFCYPIANFMVFSKVRALLGLDRCRIAVSSAAPISKDTLEFFLSLGITICEVYGMSEVTGPGTISLPDRYKTGSVGLPLKGCDVKLADNGEVCMRGPNVFLGYLKNEEATSEALDDDGWMHSGDVGEIDDDGFIRITDRIKELIITAGGKNIAPQLIEGNLKSIPVVAQAVVIGDKRKFLSALVTLDPERVAQEAKDAGSSASTAAEAAECETFQAHLQKQVDEVNDRLSRVEAIRKVFILPEELTIEGGELTPTMKLKRRVINDKYGEQIESIYE